MIESISLMNVGIIPVYPVKDSDILNYRKGLIAFYEMEDYSLYTDYFLDRQIGTKAMYTLRENSSVTPVLRWQDIYGQF